MVGSLKIGVAMSLLSGVGLFLVGPTSAGATTPTPITDCSNATGVDAAVATGGDYVFTCAGAITVNDLTVDTDVSLNANGNAVQIFGGGTNHTFDVESGTLTLTGILVTGGRATGDSTPVAGMAGTAGDTGSTGTAGDTSNSGEGTDGGTGGAGTAGTNGTAGASATGVAQGGGIYIAPGAGADLYSVTLNGDTAVGTAGANGGNGGAGGNGGWGGAPGSNSGTVLSGGNGGPAANGGDGGAGGDGSDAQGGGVYVSAGATLSAVSSTFESDSAVGGAGGGGGNGGMGGQGGEGGAYGFDPPPSAGNGAVGGQGGASGSGGSAQGGAIYNAGTVTLSNDVFHSNSATGGAGGTNFYEEYYYLNSFNYHGNGGQGGAAGPGTPYDYGNEISAPGNGGNAGAGGAGGAGGPAAGGAIFSPGNIQWTGGSLMTNSAKGGAGATAGDGGYVQSTPGTGGNGGDGGNGGNAVNGAVDPPSLPATNVTCDGDTVVGGAGGAPMTTGANGSFYASAGIPDTADGGVMIAPPTSPTGSNGGTGTTGSASNPEPDLCGSTAPAAGVYTPLAPMRICDTRAGNPSKLSSDAAQCNGTSNAGERLAASTPLSFVVAGKFSVPAGASAVVLNVTAINASTPGYLTVYPAGVRAPIASNINFPAFTAVPNLVEVGIGNGGEVSVISATSVDVAVDLQGYVSPGATGAGLYNPLSTPARICDTRAANPSKLISPATQCNGGAGNPGDSLKVDTPYPVQVTGDGGVPAVARVSAVVLNVTVVGPAAKGYLTAYPTGENPPTASNLNYAPAETVANRVIVPVSGTGEVDLYSSQATNAIVDVSGWFSTSGGTGSSYNALNSPVRICDTRAANPSLLSGGAAQCNGGTGNPGDALGAGKTLTVQVTGNASIPTNATAVVLNLTAIRPSINTYLSVYPGGTRPTVSDLNPGASAVVANLVVATLSSSGTVTIYNNAGTVNLAVDVAGWYSS